MNWEELESRFYTTFAESIDVMSLIDEYGEARVHYGLTQILSRAARGKMPDKSAVNYCVGIIKHCTEKEADVSFRKKQTVTLKDLVWWDLLRERIRDLKLEGVTEIRFNYLGNEQVIPIAQIEGVMDSYVNQSLNRQWQHWLDVVMKHLILNHLYSDRMIALSSARDYREYLPEVYNYYYGSAARES